MKKSRCILGEIVRFRSELLEVIRCGASAARLCAEGTAGLLQKSVRAGKQNYNDIVDEHNTVIMDCGGFHLLKDRPDTVHLVIYVPLNYRSERVMKAGSTADLREAQIWLEESNWRRAKFMRDLFGTE